MRYKLINLTFYKYNLYNLKSCKNRERLDIVEPNFLSLKKDSTAITLIRIFPPLFTYFLECFFCFLLISILVRVS